MKAWEYGKLRVSDNRKYLCNGDRPFFWLGDTAWLMFAKLKEEEAAFYLRNRKEKGYTVIQSTLIQNVPEENPDMHLHSPYAAFLILHCLPRLEEEPYKSQVLLPC